MNNDYLIHYGVLGMKWGVRKKRNYNKSIRRINERYKKKASKVEAKRNEKNSAKIDKKLAKLDRKKNLAKNYQKVTYNTKLRERFFYNEATRAKAAKYMTDNNMSYSKASEKAKGDAMRNTLILAGVVGGLSVAETIARRR